MAILQYPIENVRAGGVINRCVSLVMDFHADLDANRQTSVHVNARFYLRVYLCVSVSVCISRHFLRSKKRKDKLMNK